MSQTINKISNMAKSHLNNIMQILVFRLNDGNYYGINVSKIRSIEDFKRYKLIKNSINHTDETILEGYIKYQEQIIPFLNIEKWLEIYTPQNIYREILITEFSKKMIAFCIEDIYNIYNVETSQLQNSLNRDIITYSALLKIEDEVVTVSILDVERLLADIFASNLDIPDKKVSKDKIVLVAEDSKSTINIMQEIIKDTGLEAKFFLNGVEIIDYLSAISDDDLAKIGIVITDLEMPKADGYQVINFIKTNNRLSFLPVVVHSSMSNDGVIKKTKSLGAISFIAKMDPELFVDTLDKYML